MSFAVNVPSASAQSGSGAIYIQMKASTSYEWFAVGQGNSMSGSNIIVVYASEDGRNVTLSPRLGAGHIEPEERSDADVSLLPGSGIENGVMTANMRCRS